MSVNYKPEEFKMESNKLGSVPKFALGAAVIGLLATVVAYFMQRNGQQDFFYRSYLIGFLFWFNMAAGCLFWLMVQHLSGGAWGVMLRRVAEAGARTMPWIMLFFIPVIIGLKSGHLFEWGGGNDLDYVLKQKELYLNEPSFFIRLAIYIIVWVYLAYRLAGLSYKQDEGIDPLLTIRMKRNSAVGILLLFLTMTFASVDWVLSLEPHFFSTMIGPIIMAGQALGSMALIVVVMVILVSAGVMRNRLTSGHVHDYGNFLLAGTMFWAYVNFSQFLIIWSANIAEEAPYYMRRMSGGWGWIGAFLIAFHFFFPFFLLLNRNLKKSLKTLVKVALFILFLRFVDLCFLVLPSAVDHNAPDYLYHGRMDFGSIAVAAFAVIGIGGVWVTLFFRSLVKRPLLPANDPYLKEALEFRGGH